jgi:hypothetical protein
MIMLEHRNITDRFDAYTWMASASSVVVDVVSTAFGAAAPFIAVGEACSSF